MLGHHVFAIAILYQQQIGETQIGDHLPIGNEMTYVLGSRDIVAGTDYDIMTPDSPIGKAIEGAKVGDVVSYTAPNGRELSVTVKAAKPLA